MYKLESPAKINLRLQVLGKRGDGFHELSSLFQAVSLSDTLHFQPSDEDSLDLSDPGIPSGTENLIHKAVSLFRKKTGIFNKLSIRVEKRIPVQAGLGGGSGNAATTLWALNQLFGKPAQENELASWGAEIGSDVSFFFSSGTAICRGRGEKVFSQAPPEKKYVTIIKPGYGLSTPEVYRNFQLKQIPDRGEYFNDLEEAAFSIRPELKEIKDTLLSCGFSTVVLCGSGSALFCLGEGGLPDLPGYGVYRASFIQREPGNWYGGESGTL